MPVETAGDNIGTHVLLPDIASDCNMIATMPPLDPAHTPAAVVQRQLDAYNARDVDALLATYAPDAEQFEHPATPIAHGADELRRRFTARFAEANLHATLLHRAVLGNFVVDHERVTRTFPEGPGSVELVATYEVKDGRITRAWFIFGAKTLGG